MIMFPYVPPNSGEYAFEYIRKHGPKIAKVIGIGALVIGSISVLDEVAPGQEPSVAQNITVEECAKQLNFVETTFPRPELPAACIKFAHEYEGTNETWTVAVDGITMPPKDVFIEENAVGAEYDNAFHSANKKRAIGWFAVGGAIFGAGLWQRRRRENNEYNASREAMFAELDVILQPPHDNQ